MDQFVYIDALENAFLPFYKSLKHVKPILQADNGLNIPIIEQKNFCKTKNQSPDLNPIEML